MTNLVYFDTFETYAPGTPLTDGLNYWYADDTNVIVQETNVSPGNTQAAMLPIDTMLSNRFDQIASPTNVWIHLESKMVRYDDSTNYPEVNAGDAALVILNSQGYFTAYDGTSSNWVTITQTVEGVTVDPVEPNAWVTNLDVFMNYSNKTWQIARGTNLLSGNLGFANTAVSKLNGFDTYNGGNETSYLDNVYIYDQAAFAVYAVQPKALTNNWVMQGYAPAAQTFDIVLTAGPGAPAFTILTNGPPISWMNATPGDGKLTQGTNTITVDFTTNGLDVGVHTAILDVVTAVGAGITDQVAVVVTAFSHPIPEVSWTNYTRSIPKGVQPATTNLIIHNIGPAPRSGMRYDVTSDAPDWLTAAPNGVCTNGEDHIITVQFADMRTNVGIFTGTLTIRTVDTNSTPVYTPVGTQSSTVHVAFYLNIIVVGTPTGLAASEGTDAGGVQLNWQAATNAQYYEIWRAATNNLPSAALIDTSTNLVYYDASASPGLKRWYWVRAINAFGGDGDFSVPDVGWRTLLASTGLTASSGTYTNRVALNWTGALGAFDYEIWRSIYTNISLAFSIASNLPSTTTTYDDTTGDPLIVYYYWVRTHTPDMYSDSDSANGYRAALLKPESVSVSKGTFNTKIRVMWQPVDAATKYEVWRSTDANVGNAVKLGTVTIRGYDDTQVSATPLYYYWIKAHNAQGYSSPYSTMDYGWLQLATPANVTATQGTRPYSVRISWDAVENASSYEVVRSPSAGLAAVAQSLAGASPLAAGAPALITGSVPLNETARTFFDDNATYAGASYLYGVRAKNALGRSEIGGEVIGWRQARQAATTGPVPNDYDGDQLSDVVLFNQDNGLWRILCTVLGEIPVAFGDAACVPVQGDYDGDGLADAMIYSAGQSYWRVMLSLSGYLPPLQGAFGGPGQLAAAADYDNDGRMDPAVFDPATGNMTILLSRQAYAGVTYTFADGPGYVPVSADFDGDGKADPAVYAAAAGLLRIKLSLYEYYELPIPFGGAGLIVVPGDFDGDGKSEFTTYNEVTGTLSVKLSSAEYVQADLALGGPGYAWIVPGDYDGDGLLDPAAYSPTSGWMIMFSSQLYATVSDTFGGTNNIPFVP